MVEQFPIISFIIPVYNERESLATLYEKVVGVAKSLARNYQIIFVDDGSTDGSTKILCDIQAKDTDVSVAVQRRNFGKSVALAVGFTLAKGDIVVTLDADLQDDPEELPRLLAKLEEGYDLVTGWRQKRMDRRIKKLISMIANNATAFLTGIHVKDMNCGFKVMRSECARNLHLYGDLHRYIPILAFYAGYRVGEVPVKHQERQFGSSKYGFSRLYRGGLDLITVIFLNNYRRRPLHLFGLSGCIFFIMGIAINGILAIQWVQDIRPIGDRPLLLLGILLTVVGIQLFTTGLFGELIVAGNQSRENPLDTTWRVYSLEPVTHSVDQKYAHRS